MRVFFGAGPPGASEHLAVDSATAMPQVESSERCRFPPRFAGGAFS